MTPLLEVRDLKVHYAVHAGVLQRTVDSGDNRYAVVIRDQSFHVVPYSKVLERHRGREVLGVMSANQLAIGAARVRRAPDIQR